MEVHNIRFVCIFTSLQSWLAMDPFDVTGFTVLSISGGLVRPQVHLSKHFDSYVVQDCISRLAWCIDAFEVLKQMADLCHL